MKSAPRSNPYVIAAIVALGIVLAAIIVSLALMRLSQSAQSAAQAVQSANPFNAINTALPQATPTIVVRPPVIQQVRAVADLTTTSATMSTVVEVQKARVSNIVYERLLLIACGRVKAGIDLSQLREEDIRVSTDGKRVTVRLPKADVQDAYLIDDSTQPCTTKVYDRTNLLVIPETRELESQAREQAVKAIRDMALQSGMLREADRNARIIIERILLASGYESVEFVN